MQQPNLDLFVVVWSSLVLRRSVGADCPSQNPERNDGGKSHGFVHQDAGNQRGSRPVLPERAARCTPEDTLHSNMT